jgi:hypothetical protein
MGGRLTRFLNLEKRRSPTDAPPHEVATKARFEGAPPSIGLELDFGEQPFLRCPSCEADNGKHEERCIHCQRPLQTAEVHAWNAEFWEKRKAERPPAAPLPQSPPSLSPENRHLAEALAREVGERERERLFWSGGMYDSTPVGVRLLSLIRDSRTRLMVGAGMLVTFLGGGLVAFTARGHPGLQVAGAIVAMLLFVLFVPNSRRRRWWHWDDW